MIGVVLEGDATEEEGDDPRHRYAVGEEVASVRDERHETGLNLRILRQV